MIKWGVNELENLNVNRDIKRGIPSHSFYTPINIL